MIKGENGEHSEIIGENRGGTQGAIYTPPNFKLYTLPLQNAIENSRTQVIVAKVKINTSAIADDQMNMAKNKTDFMALSKIYQWYHELFKLSFGWKKT